jgi:hypothetical protein
VAFVWDDALRNAPQFAGQVRRVSFPALDRIDIPHDVIVARRGFRQGQAARRRRGGLSRARRLRVFGQARRQHGRPHPGFNQLRLAVNLRHRLRHGV